MTLEKWSLISRCPKSVPNLYIQSLAMLSADFQTPKSAKLCSYQLEWIKFGRSLSVRSWLWANCFSGMTVDNSALSFRPRVSGWRSVARMNISRSQVGILALRVCWLHWGHVWVEKCQLLSHDIARQPSDRSQRASQSSRDFGRFVAQGFVPLRHPRQK